MADLLCDGTEYHTHPGIGAGQHPHDDGHHRPHRVRDLVGSRLEISALRACDTCGHAPTQHEMGRGWCMACQCSAYAAKEAVK